jgi:hypothetical protein
MKIKDGLLSLERLVPSPESIARRLALEASQQEKLAALLEFSKRLEEINSREASHAS